MIDITELAQSYNVTTRTIRYYEELGLLKPERTSGNKRIYPALTGSKNPQIKSRVKE